MPDSTIVNANDLVSAVVRICIADLDALVAKDAETACKTYDAVDANEALNAWVAYDAVPNNDDVIPPVTRSDPVTSEFPVERKPLRILNSFGISVHYPRLCLL